MKRLGKVVDSKGLIHDEGGRFSANSAAEKETESHVKRLGDFYESQGVKDENNDFRRIQHHGRFHEAAALPASVHPGEPRLCFQNAIHLAREHPNLRYVEGYAHMGIIPTHHAWTIDEHNRVIDPTWSEKDVPTEHRAYYGVPMDTQEAFHQMIRSGSYGVMFDNRGSRRKTIGSLFEKVPDPQGHYHDERGRFAPKSAASAGVPEHILNAKHGKPHLVMTAGGAGSGKGTLTSLFVGGRTTGSHIDFGPGNSTKRVQHEIEERLQRRKAIGGAKVDVNLLGDKPKIRRLKTEALPTFSEERVIDPDKLKEKLVGMYVNGNKINGPGGRGPSGPKLMEEYNAMDDEFKHATEGHLKNLGYNSIEHFNSEHGGPDKWEHLEHGGLTHEISSVWAKQLMAEGLESPFDAEGNAQSLLYDTVGGNAERLHEYAVKALNNNFGDVTLHVADSPLEVNHENDSLRPRTTGPTNVIDTYHRAQKGVAVFERWARRMRNVHGLPVHVVHQQMASQQHIAGAKARGFTEGGKMTPMRGALAGELPETP